MREAIERIYENISITTDTNLGYYEAKEHKVMKYIHRTVPEVIKQVEEEQFIRVGEKLKQGNPHSTCYFENAFKLRYLAVTKFKGDVYEGAVIVGPYLSYEHSRQLVQTILEDKGLSYEQKEKLHFFYSKLPVVDFNKEIALANIVKALMQCGKLQHEPFKLQEEKASETLEVGLHYLIEDIALNEKAILNTYKREEEIIHYISTGNQKAILEMVKEQEIMLLNRLPKAPLRELKNLLIVANTVYRRTLCENKIEPYVIHTISGKYAIAIEEMTTKNQLQILFVEMTKAYCEVVNKYKKRGYSDLVNKTMNYIELHFNHGITLCDLAKFLFVHPNYLSQKFKQETGCAISEYINQVRIKEAKYLLHYKEELSITDIAYLIGYNDKNYFSKVFKQSEGITPKQFKQQKV